MLLTRLSALQDIFEIHLTENPAADQTSESATNRFQCPITGQEFNGLSHFYALKPCGHVLSARAFKEVKSTACLVCHKEFVEEDKIVINGTEEEVAELRKKMEHARALSEQARALLKQVRGRCLLGSCRGESDDVSVIHPLMLGSCFSS